MIRLRLRRMGAKKRPSYRIVVADSKSPRDGRFIESFGLYDPITQPATVRIDEERARHWLSVGAQPTDTVRDLFVRAGLMPAPERRPRTPTAPVAETVTAPVVETAAAPAAAPADDQAASNSRSAMTCAWISAAPSKIDRMRASARSRDTGNSTAKPLPP